MTRDAGREEDFSLMSLGDHLDELRMRIMRAILGLVVAVIITTCFGGYLFRFLCQPFYQAMTAAGHTPVLRTISTGEKMVVYFRVATLFGVMLAAPWIFWQFWQFVSAGLYAKEKRLVHVLAPLSAGLFVAGALFFIIAMAKLTLKYLIEFNVGVAYVEIDTTLANHISFMMMMSLFFGIAFQLPLLVVGLNKLGLLSVGLMNKWRKYIILLLVILAAVLTPDPISLAALGIPLYLLFEMSVLYCWLMGKR